MLVILSLVTSAVIRSDLLYQLGSTGLSIWIGDLQTVGAAFPSE